MTLQLERPLAIFDLEATGLNISKERIVAIAIIKLHPNGIEERFYSLVNPEMHIPDDVIKIHHITNEDVKDAPTFAALASTIETFIGDSDLVGYNSNKFDIPLLAEEFARISSSFDLSKRKFVDVQNIFHKMEQRTLAAAVQFYCKKELTNWHDAMVDTEATLDVLKAQLDKYPTLEKNIDFLSKFSQQSEFVDFAGRLSRNDKGDCTYNFGKHKGKSIQEVQAIEPGYYSWFISPSTDFPLYTKKKLKEEMEKIKQTKSDTIESDNLSLEEKLNALKSKFTK